jgi:hypothetical protein
MKQLLLFALLCPLLSAQPAPLQAVPAAPGEPIPRGPILGGYAPTNLDAPLVREAQSFIQSHLAVMVLGEVSEAYTQVVAGLNVKLVCSVTGDDGPSTWQFVAFRSLDGRWHFHSATRM